MHVSCCPPDAATNDEKKRPVCVAPLAGTLGLHHAPWVLSCCCSGLLITAPTGKTAITKAAPLTFTPSPLPLILNKRAP